MVVAIVVAALTDLTRAALKRRSLALVGVFAIAAYFAGVNVLVPLITSGLIAAFLDNRHRLGRGGFTAWVPVLPLLPATATARARPGVVDVVVEFAKLGIIVFGSGYVLLAFLRADLVTHLHWLTEQQVLDAVAAAK